MTSWDRRFLDLATHIAQWSKDPSTKVGCVIVGPDREIRSTGYNGFPRGVADTDERLTNREVKYPLIVHAEENAVAQAARIGARLHGCVAYTSMPPCARCARLLIQAGIASVACPPLTSVPERWVAEVMSAAAMLTEANVRLVAVDDTSDDTMAPVRELVGAEIGTTVTKARAGK